MKRAVQMAEVSLGTVHPRTRGKYHDIARMYESLKRDETDTANAILFYEKAIQTFSKADGNYSRLIGSMLNDVAVIHIQRKEYDLAVKKLSDALQSYESSIDGKGVFADTVQVWRNLAECYVLRKEWESASLTFKSALEVQPTYTVHTFARTPALTARNAPFSDGRRHGQHKTKNNNLSH